MALMTRREFGKLSGVWIMLAAIGSSILTTGCDVFTDLLNWIPVGLTAVSGILSLLTGAGIVLGPAVIATIGLIQAGLTDLKLAIIEYQSTTPPPAGALAKIDTFLSDLVTNIGNVLQQLPSGTSTVVSLVIGLFELVLSTIQGFINRLPASLPMPVTKRALSRPFAVRGKAVVIGARTDLSRRSFIKAYNKLTEAAGHSEADLPESLLQHL